MEESARPGRLGFAGAPVFQEESGLAPDPRLQWGGMIGGSIIAFGLNELLPNACDKSADVLRGRWMPIREELFLRTACDCCN
jgi:hypothetical protein